MVKTLLGLPAILSLFFLAQALYGQESSDQTIKDLATFRKLGDEAIGRNVGMEAVVTFVDPIWNSVFVQDADNAIYIGGVNGKGFGFGDKVRIVGVGKSGDLSHFIEAERIDRVGEGEPPKPIPINMSELTLGQHDCIYVSAEGVVKRALSSMGHTLYFCESGGVEFHVSMLGSMKIDELWKTIGTKYQFEGALATTLLEGAEDEDVSLGPREIAGLRLSCTKKPKPLSATNQAPLPTGEFGSKTDQDSFRLQGQVAAKFKDSLIVADTQRATEIKFPRLHGLGQNEFVFIAGNRLKDGKLDGLAAEALFSTRLPNPEEFQTINPSERNFRNVKVSGRPENIRMEGKQVYFSVTRDGQTANVKLEDAAFTNPNILENTRLLAVTGAVFECDDNGNCNVVVTRSEDVRLIEPEVPISKYIAWALFPIATLFLIGFVWVKNQRNRASARAESFNAMHAQLVSTCEAINDGLLALDNNDRVLTLNSKMPSILGCHVELGEELTAEFWEDFLSRVKNREPVEKLICNREVSESEERRLEFEVSTPEYCVYELSVSKITPEDLANSGRLLIMRDRTSERQLQAELIHSNKLEAVGQLVGGIAHDFNNILTAITANLSLLNMGANLNEQFLSRVRDAETAADRGTELVRRLLTYSGKTELNPHSQSINKIISELHKFAGATFDSRYQFHFELEECDPHVHVDLGAIEQVLLNLYLNARDAMPDGGTITTKSFLVSDAKTPTVCIWITDTGPGIPEGVREQIFDPFFTTKAGQAGTGLGLSTSKRLIIEQNGQLHCDFDQVAGTRFVITLPVTQIVEVRPADNPVAIPTATERKTILVVDDEDSIRKVASLILENHGFDVLTADNGEAALAVLSTEHRRVDLMLLDLTMPGMSGMDVLKVTSDKYPEIPVVLCSGYLAGATGELGDSCMKLSKPFSYSKLIEKITEALNLKADQDNQHGESVGIKSNQSALTN